jgi:hypothetical protein
MKDEDKYGDFSVALIFCVVIAIVLTLIFGWSEDVLPEQDQIDASPFEKHGFEEEGEW